MGPLTFDRYIQAISDQSELLRHAISGQDMATPVASCPGWNVGQLVRHLGGGQLWAAELVRTRAASPPSDTAMRDLSPFVDEDADVLVAWLGDSHRELAVALTEAGTDAELWCPVTTDSRGPVEFFARRFAHETAMHRADAVLALGQPFGLDTLLAIDGVDEWLELGVLPFHFDVHPWVHELRGPDSTVRLHATDVDISWVMDMTGDTYTWRRSDEEAAASMSGLVTELLLTIFRRTDPSGLQLDGDRAWLEFWLERVAFA